MDQDAAECGIMAVESKPELRRSIRLIAKQLSEGAGEVKTSGVTSGYFSKKKKATAARQAKILASKRGKR